MAKSLPHPVRKLILRVLAAVLLVQTVSCGTILYPERRGQPAGPIDPKVAILDGIGLLFFFVPGVIAFAVDFATGAIYLPPPGYGSTIPAEFDRDRWTRIDVPPHELDRERIEQIVSSHTGEAMSLEPGSFVVHRVEGETILRAQSPTGPAGWPGFTGSGPLRRP